MYVPSSPVFFILDKSVSGESVIIEKRKSSFTVGINDSVTVTQLAVASNLNQHYFYSRK